MGKNVGRVLRIIGFVLLAILVVELLVLSPRLFGGRSEPSANNTSSPQVAALPTAVPTESPTPLAPTPTRMPTKIPTPTLLVIATETPEPTPTSDAPEPTATLAPESAETSDEPEEEEEEGTDDTVSMEAPATSVPNGPTPTPLPNAFSINSLVHQTQDSYFTHAGPASLASLLTYWGEPTTQYAIAAVLHGSAERADDRSVTPQELTRYVNDETDVRALLRYGGTLDLLKQLTAAGFPVLIQNSFPVPGDRGWSGHYTIINGYNEQRETFLTFDPYVGPYQLYNQSVIQSSWQPFNYAFIVLFSENRADAVLPVLGDYISEEWALQKAMATAGIDLDGATGVEAFYAQFNIGTTLMGYGDHRKASTAFDKAFTLYDALPDNQKPTRHMWYNPQVYEAYFKVGRHQQVIDLADETLAAVEGEVLEESYYWRGKAYDGLKNSAEATRNLNIASQLNPTLFPPEE